MYSHIFVGGTFDRIHNGHEAILHQAFAAGDAVTIGLTSDAFIEKFKQSPSAVSPFEKRKKDLAAWLISQSYQNRGVIVPIDDPYEPAASMDDLDAIIVTRDNRIRGEEINKSRVQKGLRELTLIEVPMVAAADTQPISSTRIRTGEIDQAGRLVMPDNLRPELQQPLGTILVGDAIGSSIEKYRTGIVVTVGDVTTKTLLTAGVVPNLAIVDFQVGRKPFGEIEAKLKEFNLYRMDVTSGPGYIAKDAVALIEKWSGHPTEKIAIVVAGEEDLLALPAISLAPVGSIVYYGQPPMPIGEQESAAGMVEVLVTEEKQQVARGLLAKFL